MRRSRRVLSGVLAAAVVTGLAACSSSPAPPTDAPSASTRPSAPSSAAPPSAATFATTTVTLQVPDGLAVAPFDRPRQVQVPVGWSMALWARVDGARLAAWAPDGSLLISRPGSGDVVRLTPGPTATATPRTSTVLSGLDQPHGLAFAGGTLFVAQSDEVDSYRYANGAADGQQVVAGGLPDAKSPELHGAYAHALKSVAVGNDGAVYYSIGSTANTSADDRDASPQRATIYRVPPGGGTPEVYARGVRNGTGLAVAPDGAVWTAVNNRDNIAYPWDQPYGEADGSSYGQVIPDYVDDHPAEELAKLTPGRDLGWPFCNPDPDVRQGVAGTAYDYATPPFVRDAQTNPDGRELDCGTLAPIEQTFGAHSAPLGLSFADLPGLGAGALVGVHGSWNRQPPRPPEVSFFASDGNGGLGGQQTLLGGFQADDGSRWGRPVAAVLGPDGAVYVTDDTAGAVYRLTRTGR
ncbi:PQQ-dependent sugar dehydrogenase [Jatrophihabitans sp. YIM 134969]